jgi:hypothetical protein
MSQSLTSAQPPNTDITPATDETVNEEDPETPISDNLITQQLNGGLSHLSYTRFDDFTDEAQTNMKQSPVVTGSEKIPNTTTEILLVTTPEQFTTHIKKSAELMARKLSIINQFREKLQALFQHRSEGSFPRHILTQVKDDEKIPKAIQQYRLALLNNAIHTTYIKIDSAIADTKDIHNDLIDTLKATSTALAIVDSNSSKLQKFLDHRYFNFTSIYRDYKKLFTDILSKYASKQITDKKIKDAKQQKFLDLKAERTAKADEQVTRKDLQMEIQKLKKSKNGKPAPKPENAAAGNKNGKARNHTSKQQSKQNTNKNNGQGKGKGKGKNVSRED